MIGREVRFYAQCDDCPKEIDIKATSKIEVVSILRGMGWRANMKETVCPDCRKKRIV